MSGQPSPRASRRAVLAACGAGFSALSGCSSVDLGDDDRDYDVGRLSSIADADAPTRPDAFPVAIQEAMPARHYDRAQALVSAVPERPRVPNGVVTRRLRHEREHVVDDLGGNRDDDERETGLARLAGARYVRESAAELDGAYRAATGGVDREAVTARWETLHADLRSFEAEWAYRGGAPARALSVHAELESLRRAVRRDAEAWPPVPADPATAPFRVGERIGSLESGRATLEDADRIRRTYLEGVDEPRSRRATFTVTAHRLEEEVRWEQRWAHDYVDAEPGDPPFDRSPEDTPAEALFRDAQRHANAHVEEGRQRLRAGEPASAVLANARGLASLATLAGVVDAIRAGRYGRPEDVEVVATAHEEAVASVEAALGTEPIPVTVEVAFPALETLQAGRRYLERADGGGHGVDRAFGEFAFARRYAEAVPAAVEATVDALAESA